MLHVRILVDRSDNQYAGRVLLFPQGEYAKPICNLPLDEFEHTVIMEYERQKKEFIEQKHNHKLSGQHYQDTAPAPLSAEQVKQELVTALKNLVTKIDEVGEETKWKDGEETDRVFASYEFDEARDALKHAGEI